MKTKIRFNITLCRFRWERHLGPIEVLILEERLSTLRNDENNETIDYKISIEYDDQISSTNFIVETIHEREE